MQNGTPKESSDTLVDTANMIQKTMTFKYALCKKIFLIIGLSTEIVDSFTHDLLIVTGVI